MKSDDPTSKKPYDVGYGKPPQESRFKPGSSGNPKGRPRKRKSDNEMTTVLAERVGTRRVGANRYEVKGLEAMFRGQLQMALKGSTAAAKALATEFLRQVPSRYKKALREDRKEFLGGGYFAIPAIWDVDTWQREARRQQDALTEAAIEDCKDRE